MSNWIAPNLGSGLGNRLFQFAAAAGAAEAWGRPLAFSVDRMSWAPHGEVATILRMYPGVPLLEEGGAQKGETHVIREPARRFYEHIPLGPQAPVEGPVVIDGFRQSPGYFPKDLGRLTPDWDSALGGRALRAWLERDSGLSGLEERQRTVAIHVRLGDYKNLAHHQLDLAAYFTAAIQRLVPGQRLHLFSDEAEICARQFAAVCARRGIQFTVARKRADVEALYEMSLCLGGTITANSTFSWWGAWFAHQNGAAWATFPDRMGAGMPEPVDLAPAWGTVLSVDGAV